MDRKLTVEYLLEGDNNKNNNNHNNNKKYNDRIEKNQQHYGQRKRIKP
tara:strand:- start:755 stop:898 length:144 start_codon:yes stop_codon:yes gene_type:complete